MLTSEGGAGKVGALAARPALVPPSAPARAAVRSRGLCLRQAIVLHLFGESRYNPGRIWREGLSETVNSS